MWRKTNAEGFFSSTWELAELHNKNLGENINMSVKYLHLIILLLLKWDGKMF